MAVAEPDWSRARCEGVDPNIFSDPRLQDEAIRICHTCVIEVECLAWAIATNQADCVWGGQGPDAREAVNRPRSRSLVRCPSCKGSRLQKNEHNSTQLCKLCGLSWKV